MSYTPGAVCRASICRVVLDFPTMRSRITVCTVKFPPLVALRANQSVVAFARTAETSTACGEISDAWQSFPAARGG